MTTVGLPASQISSIWPVRNLRQLQLDILRLLVAQKLQQSRAPCHGLDRQFFGNHVSHPPRQRQSLIHRTMPRLAAEGVIKLDCYVHESTIARLHGSVNTRVLTSDLLPFASPSSDFQPPCSVLQPLASSLFPLPPLPPDFRPLVLCSNPPPITSHSQLCAARSTYQRACERNQVPSRTKHSSIRQSAPQFGERFRSVTSNRA